MQVRVQVRVQVRSRVRAKGWGPMVGAIGGVGRVPVAVAGLGFGWMRTIGASLLEGCGEQPAVETRHAVGGNDMPQAVPRAHVKRDQLGLDRLLS